MNNNDLHKYKMVCTLKFGDIYGQIIILPAQGFFSLFDLANFSFKLPDPLCQLFIGRFFGFKIQRVLSCLNDEGRMLNDELRNPIDL